MASKELEEAQLEHLKAETTELKARARLQLAQAREIRSKLPANGARKKKAPAGAATK